MRLWKKRPADACADIIEMMAQGKGDDPVAAKLRLV